MGPSLYDPALGEKQAANAKERSGFILDAMVEKGWLSQAERDAATFPEFPKYKPRTQSGPTGYLTQMVKNEVVTKYKIPQSDIDRGGLRIVSTIDKGKQADMVKAVKDERPEKTPVGARRHGLDPRRATAPSSRSTAARTTRSASRTPRPRTRCRPARRSRSSP